MQKYESLLPVVPVPDRFVRTCVFAFVTIDTLVIVEVNTDFVKNGFVGNAINGFLGAGVNAFSASVAEIFFYFMRHGTISFCVKMGFTVIV